MEALGGYLENGELAGRALGGLDGEDPSAVELEFYLCAENIAATPAGCRGENRAEAAGEKLAQGDGAGLV